MTRADPIPDAKPAAPPKLIRRRPRLGGNKLLWPVLALALLLLVDLAFVRSFFQFSNLSLVFRYATEVMLLSVGMTLVIATGGVDLSVGAVMALAGAVAAKMSAPLDAGGMDLSGWYAVAAALGVSLLAGAWNGALVALLEIQPIVATLVLMVAGRGIAMRIIGSANVPVVGTAFNLLYASLFGLPVAGLLAVGVFVVTALFVRLTSVGLFIESIGGNPTAARFAGVNVRVVTLLVYAFTGLCAGLAGLVLAADVHIANAPRMGLYMELDAILAVVIGGTALTGGRFFLAGSLVGALLIQSLTTTLLFTVPIEFTLVVKALVVLGVCMLQSETFRRKIVGVMPRVRK